MTDDIQTSLQALEEEAARDEQKNERGNNNRRGGRKDNKKGGEKFERKDKREPREKDEDAGYVEKLISVRRVTKVVKGGKNMRFSALVIVGDGKGKVGYANSKAREVPDAIKKAVSKAKKRMIKIPLKFGRTVHYDSNYYKGSARVYIRSAKAGTGVIAGGAMRSLFEALGVQDVVAKGLGTNNPFNVVRATFNALKENESPREIAKRRGLSIQDLNHRRRVLMSRKWVEKEAAE